MKGGRSRLKRKPFLLLLVNSISFLSFVSLSFSLSHQNDAGADH